MGAELIPDGRDVQLSALRSKLFVVDPAIVNNNPTVVGWRPGVQYLLENTLNEYRPEVVRQVNWYSNDGDQLEYLSPVGGLNMEVETLVTQSLALTLREPDGKYIVHRMPLICFGRRTVNWWQRFFDRDTLPDPRQSYIENLNAAFIDASPVTIELVYG